MSEATNVDDLEDGEIESDGEEITQNQDKQEEPKINEFETIHHEQQENQDFIYNKPGKKKKNKSKKGDQSKNKNKVKNKNNRKYSSSAAEDDFAGNIEKAIRCAMNKNDNGENQFEADVDERRKYKKRKKYDNNKDGPGKKRKKLEYVDEMDETEMMCVRGASPVKKNSPEEIYQEDERDSYASDSSEDRGQQQRNQRQRPSQRERNNKSNKNDRRRGGAHPMQDPDGVCLYFMQGKCHKGDDCLYSHDANPPRKMELCKFYLMDCCAKRDKCLYMHADFPCKYYHTGVPCIYKDDCKFAHGKPLTDNLKNILLKHIESAPKEILGDFPRLNREGALKMIHTTQAKLMQQYSESSDSQANIPSLFELNLPITQHGEGNQYNSYNNDRQNKISPKVRQSRWQNENSNQNNYNMSLSPNSDASNVLSIRNLTGVLTPRQISDLSKMGIENLDQLGQLTVLQLNGIGLSLKQITEIQLNTMSIQKLGLINSNNEQTSQNFPDAMGSKDLDLRVPPPITAANNLPVSSDLPGQDIDMRFQPVVSHSIVDNTQAVIKQNEPQINKDMIDIDQYTKDALKFASKENENIEILNDGYESENQTTATEIKDIDHRVLPFHEDSLKVAEPVEIMQFKKESDTDIRFRQPEPFFKSPEKRHRRSTTDDEDNNLLIDEKWYSSDEEKGNKNKKSPTSSPLQTSSSPQTPAPHVIEPSSVISRLGDLSKIDISEEVTKLLNTMKNNLNENKNDYNAENSDTQKSRDPRSTRKLSGDKVSDPPKSTSHKKSPRVSIYECVDGEPTDGRRRTDVDLRKTDFSMPTFGDTDLRQSTSSGDIDLRLGLPFKAIPNYTPASEIDGSINSHPPIPFKVVPIDIPRPDYTDIRNSTAKSQALVDPRLRKVFRLSIEESTSDSEKEKPSKAVPTGPRVDPRRKPPPENPIPENKQNVLDLQTVLQNSDWYRELSSTQKIFVNQHLAPVTQAIKQYQQEKIPGRTFDVSSIQSNTILCSIFSNLGISLGDNGELSYLPKPKEALLKTPPNFTQNNSSFGMNNNMGIPPGVSVDGNNMNMMNNMNMPPMGSMNMGGMNNINMGGMHGFNPSLPDPRGGPTPGLLGIAPNIPHNYNSNYGGPNNFGNMPYNGPAGPGNDFNFMDGDPNFRFPNRGGHRGRGNERWNRGGTGRGNRKGFNDRNNWKN